MQNSNKIYRTHTYLEQFMNNMKKIVSLVSAILALAISGCSSMKNTTPETMPENPSRVYTLSMKVDVNDGDVSESSFKPYIVIDGAVNPMVHKGNGVYEYDYVMHHGRNSAKYFFQFDYAINKIASGKPAKCQLKSSKVYEFKTLSKYVVSLEATRGNVGSRISVLGKGFTQDDKILVGGVEARTGFISDTALNFLVPAVESGKTYDVELLSTEGKVNIGKFRVDDAVMGISPSSLDLRSGEVASLTFNIGFRAPDEGCVIDVKTNVPSSVVMDEVVIPAGQYTVTVPVKAGTRGVGYIYVNSFGFKEVKIPIKVR